MVWGVRGLRAEGSLPTYHALSIFPTPALLWGLGSNAHRAKPLPGWREENETGVCSNEAG